MFGRHMISAKQALREAIRSGVFAGGAIDYKVLGHEVTSGILSCSIDDNNEVKINLSWTLEILAGKFTETEFQVSYMRTNLSHLAIAERASGDRWNLFFKLGDNVWRWHIRKSPYASALTPETFIGTG